jgi:hypothetical protein
MFNPFPVYFCPLVHGQSDRAQDQKGFEKHYITSISCWVMPFGKTGSFMPLEKKFSIKNKTPIKS